MGSLCLAPILTPHGRLTLGQVNDAPTLDPSLAQRLQDAFARGSGHALLQLGASEVGTALPPVFSYWREFGSRYVTALCTRFDAEARHPKVHVPVPPNEELEPLASAAPPMVGAEYLTAAILHSLWQELDAAFGIELSQSKSSVEDFLKHRNPAWNLVGRVYFNLAENRKDAEAPFAFLATYTTRLSAHAEAQHLPLGQALREYAGAANKERLLSLLLPVQRAAESCPWLKAMVDAGEIFHPLRWKPEDAFQFLRDVPQLESAGVVVRMPATTKRRPLRTRMPSRPGPPRSSEREQDLRLPARPSRIGSGISGLSSTSSIPACSGRRRSSRASSSDSRTGPTIRTAPCVSSCGRIFCGG